MCDLADGKWEDERTIIKADPKPDAPRRYLTTHSKVYIFKKRN